MKTFTKANLNYHVVMQPLQCMFTGFHPNVGKTFAVFTLSVWKALKKAIAQLNIRWKSFRGLLKICETMISLDFCH